MSSAAASPRARLGAFVEGYDAFARGLAPASAELAEAASGGARTFGALARVRPELGAAIEAAPGAFRATTVALNRLQPGLDGLAEVVGDLRKPAALLRPGLKAGGDALVAGAPALRALPTFTDDLAPVTSELGVVANDPGSVGALRKLHDAFAEALPSLEEIVPAQVQCNALSLFAQSFGTAYGATGFAEGPPVAFIGEKHLGSVGESLQAAVPSPGTAINIDPNENYRECESGNEPYPEPPIPVFNNPAAPVRLGNPPGLQDNHTLDTYAPDGVHERARRVGLLPTLEEAP